MPDLSPAIADDIIAACTASAAEAAAALGRALDLQVSVASGAAETFNAETPPDGLVGPGLAVVLTVGTTAAVFLLPEGTGLVPAWSANPDPTGQSKLATLAQELGMLLLPEQLMPDDSKAGYLSNLAEAVKRGKLGEGTKSLSLVLSTPERQGSAILIWPATKPAAILAEPTVDTVAPSSAQGESQPAASHSKTARGAPEPTGGPPRPAAAANKSRAAHAVQLPLYTRSLLRIRVPVVVTLAQNRQPLRRILEIGPGSIIQFDKSCEDTLDMSVGERPIAQGEAVKVGDKFGLRITSMILPDERFKPVKPGETEK